VVNDLFHLAAACRPRHGFEGASVVDWMLKTLLGLAIEMKERAYDAFSRWLIHFACRRRGSKALPVIALSMVDVLQGCH
jgi:hypothetical protein